MSWLPIRLRLTAAFAFAMAGVLTLAGVFVYLRVASSLSATLDDGLRTRVDELAREIADAAPALPALSSPRAEGNEDTLSEVLRPDGTILVSSELPGSPAALGAEIAEGVRGPTYFDAAGVAGIEGEARLLARPVQGSGGRLLAVVGASTADRSETLTGLVRSFAIGGPLALFLASALGYGLATLAMRPVEAMRSRASRIRLSERGERLPLPGSDDEIRHLGETLNGMLDRIEESLERERAFVADASHELRTPLAVIRGELELGLRPDRDREERAAAMRSAAEEVERLQRLADDLLALARSDDGRLPLQRGRADVGELLERVRLRFGGQGEAGGRPITVVAASPDGPLDWDLDPVRIEGALANLVENSLRHGGGAIELSAWRNGGELRLCVADRGAGFPDGFAASAFERFTRGESGRTGEGSGLGLAIVRAIAEAHGGRAEIDQRGSGATVELWIPAGVADD